MTLKITNNQIVSDLKQIIRFMKMTGVSLKFFIISLTFSLGLTLFNLYTVALLFPLVQGIIGGNFNHVKEIPLLGLIANNQPDIFNTSLRLFVLLIVWIYLNIVLKNILLYLSSISVGYQTKSATIKMRNLLLSRCLDFGKSFYDKHKIADIHWTITRSSNIIEDQFRGLQNLIIDTFLIIMYLSAMLIISWKLTIICGLTFPIVNGLTKRIIKKIRNLSKRNEQAKMDLNNRVFSILNCLTLVKGFAKESYEKENYQKASHREVEESFKVKKITSLLAPIEDIGITTSILLLAFGMAMLLYFDNSLNATNAFVFFYLAQNFINKLNSLNEFKLNVARSSKAVDDINNLLEKNKEHLITDGNIIFKGLKEKIEIRNLSFSYLDNSKEVIKNFNLSIPKGKVIAIVGPTGSGKSTIANLLLRFYDSPNNTIFIDGVDIKEFSLDSWRKKISFINQDNLLFNDTVKNNITYSLQDGVTEQKIKEISEAAAIADFVNLMPEKYQTIISEHGSNLSGGEKQRLSIARALIKDYDFLIIDEATSSLDVKTEQKIVEAIKTLSQNKTVLIISHRLSTVKNADEIIFLKNGEIKERGTLEELIKLRGLFYQDWNLQENKTL